MSPFELFQVSGLVVAPAAGVAALALSLSRRPSIYLRVFGLSVGTFCLSYGLSLLVLLAVSRFG